MLTKDKQIGVEHLKPGVFEREVLQLPANWYLDQVCDLLAQNPDCLNKILADRNTTLLFFMWLSYGAFFSRRLAPAIKDMPDMLWHALVRHNWIDIYSSGQMDDIVTRAYGMGLSISGRKLYTTCGDYNEFSQDFKRYLHKMYRLLNDKNRKEFQEQVPVADASEMFNCNYDSHFSMNEYIPIINRLNRHLDISELLHDLFSYISVSVSVRDMLADFATKKDPAKFPVLWERLAGHPEYGDMMLKLSRIIKTWFDFHTLQDRNKNLSRTRQK